jgi:NAD(P)H-hydrate epimerase
VTGSGELVLPRAAVRELDRRAIEEHGVPSCVLMENAGRACADVAQAMLGDRSGPALVLVGPGNNGGDGLVVARTLVNRGRDARAVFVGSADALARLTERAGDFALNLRLWRDLGRDVPVVATPADVASLAPELAGAPLVVDALFGTGLARELGAPYLDLVRAVAAAGAPVLAVDLPSGLDADTGAELGAAVRADVTVTFVGRKPGFDLAAGPAACGRVEVAEIGIPKPLLDALR